MRLKSYPLLKTPLIRKVSVNFYHKYLSVKRAIYLVKTKSKYDGKVFCIGFQKTGTTTLGRSLEMLGYKNSSFDHKVYMKYYKQFRDIPKIIDYTSKFDSFDDIPWSKIDMIPILDEKFPGSKFIYLTREEESWKKSMLIWGYKKWGSFPDMEKRLEEYREHKEFVMEYFKGRIGKDIIILNVKDKDGFKKLSDFLGKKAPQDYFPHCNKTELVPFKN